MKKMYNVDEASKGCKVLEREITPIYDIESDSFSDWCFERVFEVVRNNKKTFGCTYISGAYKGSGFNWIKGYDLTKRESKECFLLEPGEEVETRMFQCEE